MSELLRMEHISKRFGNFYANQDINFSVAKGEDVYKRQTLSVPLRF